MPDISALTVPQELLILSAAVETGIIEKLKAKPMSAGKLAELMGADDRAVWVVTEALEALGYLTKEEGRLTLSREADDMLYNNNVQSYTGFSFMHRYNVIRSWMGLPESIFTGKPYPKEKRSERTKYFMSAMSLSARQSSGEIAALCLDGIDQGAKVLDIGGGPLTYARAFASLGADVTVLDLPDVVQYMSAFLAREEKIKMVAGDFNLGLPPGPYALAFLGNICHIFGEHENRELFKRAEYALQPGGKIAIVDFIRGTSQTAALFGVNMLVNTVNGGTWTFEEYSNWLIDAGFNSVKLHTSGGRQLLLAKKRAGQDF
jgi:SAM-dependent methyltransferase